MIFNYNNDSYEVVIEKKKSNKNTYVRVKKDLKIHVTTNYFTSNRQIEKLLEDNYSSITRMVDAEKRKLENNFLFCYNKFLYKVHILVCYN